MKKTIKLSLTSLLIVSTLGFLLLSTLFYSYSPIITYDSSHYLAYMAVITGFEPWSTWDAVRGPVFPYISIILIKIFGFTLIAFQNFLFICYLLFSIAMLFLFKKVFSLTQQNAMGILMYGLIYSFILINPIVFGYFHTYLTEAIALATVPLLLLLIGKPKYVALLVPIGIILWFTKQPYAFLVLFAEFGACIYFLQNRDRKSLVQSFYRIILLTIFIVVLNTMWSSYLVATHSKTVENRGSNAIAAGIAQSFYSKRPDQIVEAGARSFLGISNLTRVEWVVSMPIATYEYNAFQPNENGSIGYRFLNKCNIIGGPESVMNPAFIRIFESCRVSEPKLNDFFASMIPITNAIFSISIFCSFLLYWPLVAFKKLSLTLSSMGLLIFGYTFTFSILATPIDRYLIPIFPAAIVFLVAAIKILVETSQKKILGSPK